MSRPDARFAVQPDLFGPQDLLPPGLRVASEFISPDLERALLARAMALPLAEARYQGYIARRRVHELAASAMPPPLQALRERLAAWVGVAPQDFVHALVSEYRPGTPLGWHRDAPLYELIVGVSLGGAARMRLRPWPVRVATPGDVITLELPPRSAYAMQGPARWGWQHSVMPVAALRHSITMRTERRGFSR